MKQYSVTGTWFFIIIGIVLSFFSITSHVFVISLLGTGMISIGMWMLATNAKHEEMVQIIMSLNQSTEDERKLFLKNLQKKPKGSVVSKIIIWFLLLIIIALIIIIASFIFQIKFTIRSDFLRFLNK